MRARNLLGVALVGATLPALAAQLTVPVGATLAIPAGALALACADLTVQGTLSAGAAQVGQSRHVTIAAGGTLNAGSSTITVGGSWANTGTFARGTSSVVFADGCDTSAAQITGSTDFASLALTSTSGRTFVLPASGVTSASTALTLTGAPGTPIQVVSSNPSQPTWIALGNGATVTSTNAQVATNVAIGTSSFEPAPAVLAFGGQSMRTTAPALAITFANGGLSAVTVTSITAPAHFAVTHDCATVAAGGSCDASITFTPMAEGVLDAVLTIQSSAGTKTVGLTGTGERSLITHYYRSILRRPPDGGGKSFWQGEAARLQSIGANVNEAWFAMAQFFYSSAEYASFNRDAAGFVTDLYTTFFNRPADAGGLAYWTGLIAQGMPREVVLASFMFSSEFTGFTQAIFGNTAARAEVDVVMDFYRGLLARLPDPGGFDSWVAQFRAAQCADPGAVYQRVESISSAFTRSAEYTGKARTDSQYVGDLYNAFLRRGGDLGGVQYWIGQLATSARTREAVRVEFRNSSEFQARVAAVVAQGCQP
jgi:hypothetical protein